MRKNRIQNIVVHEPDARGIHARANRVNAFHVDVIERRLNQSNLTTEQKIVVMDKIMENLKSREINGFIQ